MLLLLVHRTCFRNYCAGQPFQAAASSSGPGTPSSLVPSCLTDSSPRDQPMSSTREALSDPLSKQLPLPPYSALLFFRILLQFILHSNTQDNMHSCFTRWSTPLLQILLTLQETSKTLLPLRCLPWFQQCKGRSSCIKKKKKGPRFPVMSWSASFRNKCTISTSLSTQVASVGSVAISSTPGPTPEFRKQTKQHIYPGC